MWSSPAHDRVDSHEQFNSNHFGLLLPKWFLFSKNLSTRLGASLFIVQNRGLICPKVGESMSVYGGFNMSAYKREVTALSELTVFPKISAAEELKMLASSM